MPGDNQPQTLEVALLTELLQSTRQLSNDMMRRTDFNAALETLATKSDMNALTDRVTTLETHRGETLRQWAGFAFAIGASTVSLFLGHAFWK